MSGLAADAEWARISRLGHRPPSDGICRTPSAARVVEVHRAQSAVASDSRTALPHLSISLRWNSANFSPPRRVGKTPSGSNLLRNASLTTILAISRVSEAASAAGRRAGAKTAHHAVVSNPA